MHFEINDKNKKTLGIIILILIVIFSLVVGYFIGVPLVKYANNPSLFRDFVDKHGFISYIVFCLMSVFQTIFALVPGEPFEILAGYSFGAFGGTVLCLISSIIGSSIVFFLSRKLGTKFVELFFSAEKIASLNILQDKTKVYLLTFILFFIPGTPKDLLSYVAGLTPIPYLSYILITTVAKIPSVITSAIGGDALGDKKYLFAIIAFAVTAIISLSGILIYKKMTKKQ